MPERKQSLKIFSENKKPDIVRQIVLETDTYEQWKGIDG